MLNHYKVIYAGITLAETESRELAYAIGKDVLKFLKNEPPESTNNWTKIRAYEKLYCNPDFESWKAMKEPHLLLQIQYTTLKHRISHWFIDGMDIDDIQKHHRKSNHRGFILWSDLQGKYVERNGK